MTLHEWLWGATRRLTEVSPTPRLDARLLAGDALAAPGEEPVSTLSAAAIHLSFEQQQRLKGYLDRRLAREPVSRILGRRGFWDLDLVVTPDTLDPRPDSETLIDVAQRLCPSNAPATIVDFGTGSGCLLLALLQVFPAARGVGVDLSEKAVAVARSNAHRNGLGDRAVFFCGNWDQALVGPFDLMVSNPPYIPDGDISGLAPEVRDHDPGLALAGGPDGLAAYRCLADGFRRVGAGRALALVEIGIGQADAVTSILEGSGGHNSARHRDLAGVERCISVSYSCGV